MNKPTRFSRLSIGSAASIARDPLAASTPDLVNLSVRADDRRAFLGVIHAREQIIEKKIDRFVAKDQGDRRLTEETANCALDAFIEINSANPDRDLVKARLELTAAMAIAALNALKGAK